MSSRHYIDLARQVIDSACSRNSPVAVFIRDGVCQMMPAAGKRFAGLQRKPERMAHYVGAFDASATHAAIAEALRQADGNAAREARAICS